MARLYARSDAMKMKNAVQVHHDQEHMRTQAGWARLGTAGSYGANIRCSEGTLDQWRIQPVSGRADLTDAQWAVLEPLLPKGKKPGRPPTWAKRQLIDGIRWRTRARAPWRDVPERYRPWAWVYGLFRAWQRDGTWAAILASLQALADAAGLITWDVSLDSTGGAGAPARGRCAEKGDLQAGPPGGVSAEPADHGSRGVVPEPEDGRIPSRQYLPEARGGIWLRAIGIPSADAPNMRAARAPL